MRWSFRVALLGWTMLLCGQETATIRKVYLTGSKQNAIHSGRNMLQDRTCLEVVNSPELADAVIDLEIGTVQPIRQIPQPEPTGFVTCESGRGYVSCSELGGATIVTSCAGRGGNIQCSSYSYDGGAMLAAAHELMAEGYQALERKLTTHAYVTDKEGKGLLWDYDEGRLPEGVGAWHSMWWDQFNSFVGCGKIQLHYKKKHARNAQSLK